MSRDYEEFIAALNDHGVRYLVVGAHALAVHAKPRATKDLDIWLEPTPDNARRLLAAIGVFFGGEDLGYSVEELLDPRWIIQLGVAPVRIDLLSEILGLPDFSEAYGRRLEGKFGPVDTVYVGLDDLIAAKRAAGRKQDEADLMALERARRRRTKC